MTKVEISRGLLAGLVAVAAAASLGLAFLLGRASGPSRTAGAGVPAGAAQQVPPGTPAPAPPDVPVPRDSPARAAVAAYFKAVEAVQPAAGGEPEAVAMQMAAGLGNGDTSGIDGLIQQTRTTRTRLAALAPPQPCAAYHQELLGSLDDGLAMMQSLKKLVASPNLSALASEITDRANAMKVRSESLKSQEKALKQRYCE